MPHFMYIVKALPMRTLTGRYYSSWGICWTATAFPSIEKEYKVGWPLI